MQFEQDCITILFGLRMPRVSSCTCSIQYFRQLPHRTRLSRALARGLTQDATISQITHFTKDILHQMNQTVSHLPGVYPEAEGWRASNEGVYVVHEWCKPPRFEGPAPVAAYFQAG